MNDNSSCLRRTSPDYSGVTVVELDSPQPLKDYLEAMNLANAEASSRLGRHMLLSWYDRDRDFESPQHSSECHAASAVPGYVDYGINRGASLKVNIEQGRFGEERRQDEGGPEPPRPVGAHLVEQDGVERLVVDRNHAVQEVGDQEHGQA